MPRSPAKQPNQPVSEKIRARLKKARHRYFANDNISEFIAEGEHAQLLDEVASKMQGVLESLVIDVKNDHNTQGTARRVAKMYINEVFKGRYAPTPRVTEFPNVSNVNELMIVGPIKVRSGCSHHFCPIIGRLWIGILPNKNSNLIGLSKYTRLVEWILSRPQIQEEALIQVADMLMKRVKPDGLAVVMDADHFCIHWRGVKDAQSRMLNSVMRGAFLKNPQLRNEFLTLLPRKES